MNYVLLQQGRLAGAFWLQEADHVRQVEGGNPFLLLNTGETHLECLIQCWAPQHERQGHAEASPTKSHEGD